MGVSKAGNGHKITNSYIPPTDVSIYLFSTASFFHDEKGHLSCIIMKNLWIYDLDRTKHDTSHNRNLFDNLSPGNHKLITD